MQSYIFDVIRSTLPALTLDQGMRIIYEIRIFF